MPDITQHTLTNGLRIVVEHNPGVESAALTWLLPCGVANDPKNLVGRSAIWAELLLRGAGALDSRAQADAFDRLGATRSTSVTSRFLSVGVTVLGSRMHEALPRVTEMVTTPGLDDASIEPSRALCLQAIDALQDEPAELAALGARARHLPQPFNRSALGTSEGLNALGATDIRDAWSAHACPGGAILAIAGRVDADRVIHQLEELLAPWAGQTTDLVFEGNGARGYHHHTEDTNQVQIILMHDAPPENDDDAPLERLLVRALSGGMSARLFTEVREKRGLCYSVHARYATDRDFGLVTASVGTQPDRAQESLDVLVAELQRVSTPEGKITHEEFGRATAGLKSKLVFSGESTSARASAIATDLFRLGRPRTLEEIISEIDGITLDRLNAYAQSRVLGRVTVQTLGPAPLEMPGSLS